MFLNAAPDFLQVSPELCPFASINRDEGASTSY